MIGAGGIGVGFRSDADGETVVDLTHQRARATRALVTFLAIAATGIASGNVTASASPAIATLVARSATGVRGPAFASPGVLTATAKSATGIVSGNVTATASPAMVACTAIAATGTNVTVPPQTATATPASLTAVGKSATGVVSGGVAAAATPAQMLVTGKSATGIASGNVSAAATPALVTSTAKSATGAASGNVTASASPAHITCAAKSATGALTVTATPAQATIAGKSATGIASGSVTASASPATATFVAVTPTSHNLHTASASVASAVITAVAATGSNWSPLAVSSLVYWFDPNVGITKDGSNNVTAWVDRKSSLSPTISTNKPVWTANRINGQPTLVASATGTLTATITDVLSGGSFHLFIARKQTAANAILMYGTTAAGWRYNNISNSRVVQTFHTSTSNFSDGTMSTTNYEMAEVHYTSGVGGGLVINGTDQGLNVNVAFTTGGTALTVSYASGTELGHIVLCNAEVTGTALTNMRAFFRNAYAVY